MATTLAELGNAEWAATPKGLPPGALMRPMGAVRGLPSGAMLRPVKQSSASSRQLSAGTQKLITHPAGKVTGIDEETGLPIVRRDEAHKPEKQPSAVSRQPSVEAESSDRPVVQGSNDAGEIRASAKEQEPVLQAMVAAVTAAVPGAKVEGVRVKKDASQETKAERGKPAETNIDNLGARLSANSRSALEKLRDHIEKKLPVENKSKITSNGLDMDQYSIRTGGKDAANQVSELQVGGKDQVDALKQTEPLYEKQKKAEARGDKAEAARLGAEITAMHKAATRDQFKAASQQVSKLASRQNETKAPVGETKYKFGNTQANIPDGSDAAEALDAFRDRIPDKHLAGDGKDVGDGGNHVTVRYGIRGDRSSSLGSQSPEQGGEAITASSSKPKENSDAVQKPGAGGVLQYPQEGDGKAGSGRGGVELSQQGDGYAEAQRQQGSGANAVQGSSGKTKEIKTGAVVRLKDGRAGVVKYFNPTNGQPARARVRGADNKIIQNVRPEEMTLVTAPPVDPESGWYGCDLDGTLAEYHGFEGLDKIGAPVGVDSPDSALNTVKKWIAEGRDVRILSARISHDPKGDGKAAIEAWTEQYLGRALPVTEKKDAKMITLLDDRAVQVEENTGRIVGGAKALQAAGDAHRQGEKGR